MADARSIRLIHNHSVPRAVPVPEGVNPVQAFLRTLCIVEVKF